MRSLRVKSSAKVNFTLDILGVLPNGYHELRSLVHTIGIWDDLQVTEQEPDAGIAFSCSRADLSGGDNLVVKAAHKYQAASGKAAGVRVHLSKVIPSGAGLGGGSGNAAAMLLALDTLSPRPLGLEKLAEIGQGLGADVPLFLHGGAMLMEGVGEKLTSLAPLDAWLVVIKPQVSLGTPEIYRAWDEGGFASSRGTEKLLSAWPPAHEKLALGLSNDLELAAERAGFVAGELLQQLLQSGALGARMTGSGSACFGVFASSEAANVAQTALEAELSQTPPSQRPLVFLAPLCRRGVEISGAQ